MSKLFIDLPKYEHYLPSAYDESMSLLQKTNKTILQLHELGHVTADMIHKWNEVYEWVMNEGIEKGVLDTLSQWKESGYLNLILNESILQHYTDIQRFLDSSIPEAQHQRTKRNMGGIIRIGSFNFGDMDDGDYYVSRQVQRYLIELAADVVGLQETWNGLLRSPKQLTNELYPFHYFGKTMYYEPKTGDYGNTLIGPQPFKNTQNILFNMENPSHEPRAFSKVNIELIGTTFTIFNTHFSHETNSEVLSQMKQLYAAVSSEPNPHKIIMADFNTTNFEDFKSFTDNGYTLTNTTKPTTDSKYLIDNIIISPTLELVKSDVMITEGVSDHEIVWADIKVKGV